MKNRRIGIIFKNTGAILKNYKDCEAFLVYIDTLQGKRGNKMSKTRNEVKKLRPIDDIFFEKLIEDKNVCEEILRIILEDDKLEVLSVTPQSNIRNLYGRSVRLDAFCKLGSGVFVNIEVQKSDNDDHVRRVRYNAACITANNTEVGADFITVPNVTMIYISTFDMFKKGRTIYHCKTVIEETGEAVDNGLEEIYVNTAVNDGSTVAELMKCFLLEQVDNKKFPMLSNRVWYFKNDEGGINAMCKIVEDYANEISTENIRNLFDNGGSLELAIATFKNIKEDVIRKIYEEVNGAKRLA